MLELLRMWTGEAVDPEMLAQLNHLLTGSLVDRVTYIETSQYFRTRERLLVFLSGLHDGWGIPAEVLETFLLKHAVVLANKVDLDALRVSVEDFDESRFMAWYMCAHHVPPNFVAAPYMREIRGMAVLMLEEGRLSRAYCASLMTRGSVVPTNATYMLYDDLTHDFFRHMQAVRDLDAVNPSAAQALRDLPATRDRVFVEQWLPNLLPGTEYDRVRGLSLPLLRELYADIYAEGAQRLYQQRTRAVGLLQQ